MKIFHNPLCYISLNQLTRDLLFKSFSALDFCALYNMYGEQVDNLYDIPNSHKYAFLSDYDTSLRHDEQLVQFIKGFDKKLSENAIKVQQILENFPTKKTQELKLKDL